MFDTRTRLFFFACLKDAAGAGAALKSTALAPGSDRQKHVPEIKTLSTLVSRHLHDQNGPEVAIAALEADFLVSAAPIAVAWLPVIRSGRSWAHFERKTSAHHFGVQAWACFRAPSVFFCTGLTFLYSQLSRIGNLFSPKCPVKHYVGTLSILPDTMLILSTGNFGAKKNCLFINI